MRTSKQKFVLAILFFCFSGKICIASSDQTCRKLYQKKLFNVAANCFIMMSKTITDQEQKFQKGQWLRNAAVSLKKAAKIETNMEKAGFLLEKATIILKQYLSQNLCPTANRCATALALRATLLAQIGYARLSVVLPKNGNKVEIEGHKLRKTAKASMMLTLRPGTYLLRHFSGKKLVSEKKLQLKKNDSVIKTFLGKPGQQTQQKRPVKLSTLSKKEMEAARKENVFIYSGAGVIGVGAIVLGIGVAGYEISRSDWQNPGISEAETAPKLRLTSGLSFASIPVILGGTALIIVGLVKRNNRNQKKRQSKMSQTQGKLQNQVVLLQKEEVY